MNTSQNSDVLPTHCPFHTLGWFSWQNSSVRLQSMQRKQIPNHFVKSLAKMFAVGLRHEVFHAVYVWTKWSPYRKIRNITELKATPNGFFLAQPFTRGRLHTTLRFYLSSFHFQVRIAFNTHVVMLFFSRVFRSTTRWVCRSLSFSRSWKKHAHILSSK